MVPRDDDGLDVGFREALQEVAVLVWRGELDRDTVDHGGRPLTCD